MPTSKDYLIDNQSKTGIEKTLKFSKSNKNQKNN